MLNKISVVATFLSFLSASVWAANGMQHLEASRDEVLDVERRKLAPVAGAPESSEKLVNGTLVCKSNPITSEAVRALEDTPLLGHREIWPGQLIQGKFLPKGKFVPIPNKRSAGRLIVKGLQFKDKEAQNSVLEIEEMSEANVNSAISNLLSQPISSFEANVSFAIKPFYSVEQMAFDLGADDRFLSIGWRSMFTTNPKRNQVLLAQTQIFYTISFEHPESMGAVFKEELEDLEDNEEAFGAGNPPVYVKQVNYGSEKYVIASSTEPVEKMKSALEAAWSKKTNPADMLILADMSFVSYAAGMSDAPAITPIKKFEDLKSFFAAQPKQLKGVPISATFNYLSRRNLVALGYSTSYDKRECKVTMK